jgi:AcrR family transcriptional regulator
MSIQMTTGERRPYRKRRRAGLEADTRMRITEAEMALHGSVGPAHTTISAVAERAGVQRATVYRHFPTREALVEATYRNELARLCDSAPDLLRTLPPDEAMRTWMDRFIDYMATKQHTVRRCAP